MRKPFEGSLHCKEKVELHCKEELASTLLKDKKLSHMKDREP
jgi:hypothetical protein